jgi:hypothetical protein
MMAKQEGSPRVLVSWGELVDKVTILEIKIARIKSEAAVANCKNELAELLVQFGANEKSSHSDSLALKHALAGVNAELWEIEDSIRRLEYSGDFGPVFVQTARRVYALNDRRSAIKREINVYFSSYIVEEKSYKYY